METVREKISKLRRIAEAAHGLAKSAEGERLAGLRKKKMSALRGVRELEKEMCPKCEGNGKTFVQDWSIECMYCDGNGGTVDAYFTCGVDGCGYRKGVPGAVNIHRYTRDKGHMVSHYKWEHAYLVGTKVYPYKDDPSYWLYDYRPIPDDIGPTLTYEGEVTTWAELCEFEGRA